MNNQSNDFVFKTLSLPGESLELIGRLFDVAQPDAIYSETTVVGDYTIFTASELFVSMGAGYGGGGNTADDDNEEDSEGVPNFGGGGGGGGLSMGRPVAAITVGPDGVRVDPIVDPTKISIAFFTTLAAMAITLSQVWRLSRRK